MEKKKLAFASDYMKGAHPKVLARLVETNAEETPGYGSDRYTEEAKEKIRRTVGAKDAAVYFLVGGTQTNAAVIDAFLLSYQGVVAADTGHVSVHEAGAIEANGHKVLTVPHKNGKLTAETLRAALAAYFDDENRDHMVMPGLVYISQPTELGTLYSKEELTGIRGVCGRYGIPLFLDGARLAYALACPENDLTLPDLARLCDAFYIGGTKCGALFGEAVVVPDPGRLPHFFTLIKQHGALLAKGRLLGVQFDALFTDGLYETIGTPAIRAAEAVRSVLRSLGYPLYIDSPTNQVFPVMENGKLARLREKAEVSFWEKYDEDRTVIRIATDWGTTKEETDALLAILRDL